MSFIDCREIAHLTRLETDIAIVGAGAAGITLARQLALNGRDIILVESGGLIADESTQALAEIESTGYPQRPDFMSRARYFGGSCNLWAGRSMRLAPLDLQPRPWVPGSGWPLPYAELTHYYVLADRVLSLPGEELLDPAWLRKRLTADEAAFFAQSPLAPNVSLWAPSPQRFSFAVREFRRSTRVRVLLHALAMHVQLNEAGDIVESLTLGTLAGNHVQLRARQFVLASGGIENARLLLVSRDRQPQGIANHHDQVGRYFMDHPRTVYGKVHIAGERRLPWLRGRPVAGGKLQVGLALARETQACEQLLNHYVTLESMASSYTGAGYDTFVQTMKVLLRKGHAGGRFDLRRARTRQVQDLIYLLSPKEILPHFVYRCYVAARDALPRRARTQSFVAVYFCEQPPDPQSRVTLSDRTDRLGVPLPRLHWNIDDGVTRTVLRLQDLLAQRLQATGAGTLEKPTSGPAYTDASHHMGTTRMSADPASGVVDSDCKVHGVHNLHVAGSSVFPSAGHANPTLTIVALALRLADRLRRL